MKTISQLGISPFPWTASQTGLILKKDVRPRDNGDLVAVCCGCYEIDSNVRLIAAAPELYECLREALETIAYTAPVNHAKWRAALAKASGA